jgi:hypothetical protein
VVLSRGLWLRSLKIISFVGPRKSLGSLEVYAMPDSPNQTPSWHNSKWYTNHPEVPRPAQEAKPVEAQGVSVGLWIPRTGGVSLVGGFGLMKFYFWAGLIVVYISLVLLLWDLCVDPLLIKGPVWVQIIGVGILFCLFGVVTAGVVGAQAPMSFNSYAMLKGNYANGIEIGGIKWDSHLTDLRVAVTNPDDRDYTDVDLTIRPDKWTYQATILNKPSDCDLTALGGDTVFTTITKGGAVKMTMHRLGDSLSEAQDDVGDVFTPLVTAGGYRLRCSRLAAHFTVRLVFAVASVSQTVSQKTQLPKLNKPGDWGMAVSEWAGVKSEFDILDVKPSPSRVNITGRYTRIMKPYSIKTTVAVENGN